MANTVIIGAQWGDEGKGKIVDMLSAQSGLIVRFQGGNNAGHTIKVQGRETILHLIPSGILHEGKNCLIGNGVVLDPFVFLKEVDELAAKGIDVSPGRLGISKKTHLIMPYHKSLDNAREAKRAGKKIATTGRPRRCGWLDIVILRETVRLCGLTDIALTKLDVLQNLPALQICVAYELDGQRLEYPPQEEGALGRVKPVYEEMPGFEDDISQCTSVEQLPDTVRAYIARIEELTGVRVSFISVGADRAQTIVR